MQLLFVSGESFPCLTLQISVLPNKNWTSTPFRDVRKGKMKQVVALLQPAILSGNGLYESFQSGSREYHCPRIALLKVTNDLSPAADSS